MYRCICVIDRKICCSFIGKKTLHFPVDGKWSTWLTMKCDVFCGDGTEERVRTCSDPPPSGRGAQECTGEDVQTFDCAADRTCIGGEICTILFSDSYLRHLCTLPTYTVPVSYKNEKRRCKFICSVFSNNHLIICISIDEFIASFLNLNKVLCP